MNFKKLLIPILVIATFITACNSPQPTQQLATAIEHEVEERVPEFAYGFSLDSFKLETGVIKANEFLADILLKYHVDYVTIQNLADASKKVFDVRKFRANKEYTILTPTADSTNKAAIFIYHPSKTEYVVFDIRDSINIYKEQKEVTVQEREVAGTINSSLYATLIDQKVDAALAITLSEIYAWSIDFYRVQKGDNFKVVFEEKYVDNEFVGIGAIKAALFNHYGEDFYAIPFEQDSIFDFYDQEGKSLRKAFLKSPLKFGRMTSAYTMKRFHPVQKRYKAHLGTDYAAAKGTPILAVGDGIVIESTYKKYNGNYVKIKHNGTYTTQYLHMSKRAAKVGQRVRQGEVIGYVGSTGLATGPHVCFRFWKNGKQVDHRREKLPASKPVKPELMNAFNETKTLWVNRLNSIQEQPNKQSEQLALN